MATQPKAAPLPFIHPDDMPTLYAINGRGTCMEPEIADGAVLAFDKRPIPQPGDIVGLIFTREYGLRCGMPGMVKRLTVPLPPDGLSGLIVVEQLNPRRVLTVASRHVLAVHRCIGEATLGAEAGRAFVRRDQIGGGE